MKPIDVKVVRGDNHVNVEINREGGNTAETAEAPEAQNDQE